MSKGPIEPWGTVLLATLVLVGVGSLPFASMAIPADFSYRGSFSADDDVQLFSFVTDGASVVVIKTYGYGGGIQADGVVIPSGGFDPVLEVFDAAGSRVDGNDDGTDLEVVTDPLTGSAVDVYLASTLHAGTYIVAIVQYDNHAIGPALADGFSRTGVATFTSAFQCSHGQFCDHAGNDRTRFWALDILGAEAATIIAQDRDLDAIPDESDNCPTVANPLQEDGGGGTEAGAPGFDGVGDACDNCTSIHNPRVEGWTFASGGSAFLSSNPWATLTGGQRDDDHDGFGNKCDGDFTPAGLTVGPGDTAQYIPSLTKSRSALTGCGSPPTQRCARYDLDEAGGSIGPGDTAVFARLLLKAAGPKCPTCPLPCEAGALGGCEP